MKDTEELVNAAKKKDAEAVKESLKKILKRKVKERYNEVLNSDK